MPQRSLARDEACFVASVLIGTIGGIVAARVSAHLISPVVAGNVALAMATTLTGATHARLVHHRSIRSLLPSVAVGAPLAYLVMHGIHALLRA